MPDDLDKLGKTTTGADAKPTKSSSSLIEAKWLLNSICDSLTVESIRYDPNNSVNEIKKFIDGKDKKRILYSEISPFIMGLDEKKRATMLTNMEKLISFVLEQNVNNDVRNICIKLYDHFQLNLIQLENNKKVSEKAIAESISNEKISLHNDVKRIEREYITVLGIFAAIMLAFVGGFTFSTSVLNNIDKTDPLTLALIALIIGLVFVILLTVLIGFLREVSEKSIDGEKKPRTVRVVNIIVIAVLFILICISIVGRIVSTKACCSTTQFVNQVQIQEDVETTDDTILSPLQGSEVENERSD